MPVKNQRQAAKKFVEYWTFQSGSEKGEDQRFWKLLKNTESKNLRRSLLTLFRALDTPEAARDPYLEPEIAAFPYTNGGLFKGVDEAEIPPLDDEIQELLVKPADFDWRDISPTIFGALFESTQNPVTRRAGGMVYTSVENIHKVIDPLFLNDLARRVEEATKMTEATKGTLSAKSRSSLLSLQSFLSSLTFLDPACGSGNFLTETFLSLRRLENRIIAALQQGQGELWLDFAVAVAKTAMWISEAQMLQETAQILHREPDYLPLKDYANIVEGNALRMDWGRLLTADAGRQEWHKSDVLSPKSFSYIMGNPPFSGARWMGRTQKEDMLAVFGKGWQGVGDLDYVTAWYKKAMDCVLATKNANIAKVAFVSTNSICQGGAVASLWKPLFEKGLEIDFAHRTFRWDNETIASERAHVHCVIVGFHAGGPASVPAMAGTESGPPKTIFDDGAAIPAAHINGYLMDAPDIFIESRSKPLCDVPPIGIGNKPIDGDNYLFTKDGKDEFLKQEPQAAQYFHPWYGAEEFINGKKRFCLWLGDCAPAELFKLPECLKRVQSVRDYRLSSKSAGTRKIADKPTRFHVENFPKGNYIVIPEVSSERRRYIPMGYLAPDVMCSNKLRLMPDATLFHFGVLNSSVHNAWVRAVCGRLETRYDYSINIVYNNFPWPEGAGNNTNNCKNNFEKPGATAPGEESAARLRGYGKKVVSCCSSCFQIEKTAQAILDARAKCPDATLAQMYRDKVYLFPELVAAHEANDRAVLAAYGLKPDTSEPEIVAHLFGLYGKTTEKTEGTKGTEATKAASDKETAVSLKAFSSLKSLSSPRSFEGGPNG